MTKVVVSSKQIIKIDEFMRNYIGKEYSWNGKITHRQMELFLIEKHISIPKRVSFDLVSKESLLKGDYIAVKDEKNQTLIYENPRKYSLNSLLSELHTRENEKRTKQSRLAILKELGYQEAVNGVVRQEEDIEYPLEHNNRQKQFVFYRNNTRRKRQPKSY